MCGIPLKVSKSEGLNFFLPQKGDFTPPPFFLKDSRSSLDKLQCRGYILNKCNPRTTVDDVDMAIVWWICLTECNPWTKVDDVDPTVVCSS